MDRGKLESLLCTTYPICTCKVVIYYISNQAISTNLMMEESNGMKLRHGIRFYVNPMTMRHEVENIK